MHELGVFAASFAFIALKSWQQLNVVRKAYPWIVPTSLLMAVCEVYVIANIAVDGFGSNVLFIGLGGGLGSLTATWCHYRFIQRRSNP